MLQSGKPGAQESRANNFFEERKFLFEVKHIDEFFERFNDDKNSFIRRNIGKYYPGIKINRISLLNTLFDKDNKIITIHDKKQFVKTVSDYSHPYYLSFYDRGWYAELTCLFYYSGQTVPAIINMRISTDSSLGSKWMISSIHCEKVKKYTGESGIPQPANPGIFLSPVSHTTNFIGLVRAFEDKVNIRAYLEDDFLKDTASLSFLHAWMNDEMSFQYVKSVQYYFFQVPGWTFKVGSCMKEKSVNTGWLITGLQRTEKSEKEKIGIVPDDHDQ